VYDLQAVVAHLGTRLNSGHYIAVVRSADYWLLYDDRSVQVGHAHPSL
jgi:ubiquitin carboxyl-terminal hydrolase 12/46